MGPEPWTAGARLEPVITTAAISEACKSARCREHGLYPADLDKWRAHCSVLRNPRQSPALQRWRARQGLTAGDGRPQTAHPTPSHALSPAERAKLRPVFHDSEPRVRAHVFLCMLACCVEWHMRQRLKPMPFDDEQPDLASASRTAAVAKAQRSAHAKDKDASKTADDGLPLHSFRTLLDDLPTLACNVTRTTVNPQHQDRRDHPAHAGAGQGLRTARAEPDLYPVAVPPANRKFKRGGGCVPVGAKVRTDPAPCDPVVSGSVLHRLLDRQVAGDWRSAVTSALASSGF